MAHALRTARRELAVNQLALRHYYGPRDEIRGPFHLLAITTHIQSMRSGVRPRVILYL
jgi:hypothetical protein